MDKNAYIDKFTDAVDMKVLARAFFDAVGSLPGEALNLAKVDYAGDHGFVTPGPTSEDWNQIPKPRRAELFGEPALRIWRRGLDDLYDRIHFSHLTTGKGDVQREAQRLYAVWVAAQGKAATAPPWPMIGEAQQDAWTAVAEQMILSQEEAAAQKQGERLDLESLEDLAEIMYHTVVGANSGEDGVPVVPFRAISEQAVQAWRKGAEVVERIIMDPPHVQAILQALKETGQFPKAEFMNMDEMTATVVNMIRNIYASEEEARVSGGRFDHSHQTDDVDTIRAEREAVYGHHHLNHVCIGLAWRGILQEHWNCYLPGIPPDVVQLMIAAQKVMRMARTKLHADSALDGKAYMQMALESQEIDGGLRPDPTPLMVRVENPSMENARMEKALMNAFDVVINAMKEVVQPEPQADAATSGEPQ